MSPSPLARREWTLDALDAVATCRRHANTAQADVWEYIAFFCDAAAAEEADRPTSGVVHTWAYGGAGTPEVPEGAVVELATELGESREATTRQVAVAMNLAHRLARVRAATESGTIDWRKAELVSWSTVHLSVEAAAAVQETLLPAGADPESSLLARITKRRLNDVVAQALLDVEPEQEAEDDVEAALAARDVRVEHSDRYGVCDVVGTVSTEDGARLIQSVRRIARWLRETGDDRPAGVRRSVGLAMLADPARVQELWERVRAQRLAQRAARPEPAGDPDHDVDALEPIPPAGVPGTQLFVHLDRASNTWTLDGISATDPCAGILTRAEARRLVGHDRVRVTPVLDLAAELTYTSYGAPPRLKSQLALRNHGRCAFPSCDRHASIPAGTGGVDYDHSPPWPEGRTCSTDGAMLCEPHHRAKTFLGWDVRQVAPGSWLWTSPARRRYLVTAGTTTALDC